MPNDIEIIKEQLQHLNDKNVEQDARMDGLDEHDTRTMEQLGLINDRLVKIESRIKAIEDRLDGPEGNI